MSSKDENRRREYNRKYYQSNRRKYRLTAEQRTRRNARKRELYANNPEVQQYYKKRAAEYRKKNPTRRRHAELQNRYGLTPEQYEALLSSQHGACAICRKEFTATPHVDHNHVTNKTRGLLCDSCNLAIGMLGDNWKTVERAAFYLKWYECQPDEMDAA